MTNIANLSPEAKSALLSANVSRRGATVPQSITDAAYLELIQVGYIGPRRGLTDVGVIARTKLINSALDAAF